MHQGLINTVYLATLWIIGFINIPGISYITCIVSTVIENVLLHYFQAQPYLNIIVSPVVTVNGRR